VRAIVVAGGSCDPSDADLLTDADLVVAADGGASWLVTLLRMPDLLVGDLDSAPPALVEELEAAGVPIERHPVDKDASDLELALAAEA
jgi:thiamine pyrophosphokinase